ncbi:hypothetical protein FGG08_003306 [Glutinoglossum americanum]|uniref:Uncharacterized protein n=1 Tax=Glutinoglossum americanum TaxID=1670608 RepID=A0A9P8L0S2_9PEZI|nr:hypothetical protein FGG08_003306 [Glutinoglossum americanum]
MSVVAITLSASVVIFVVLSLAIIFCIRARQKHLIDAYHRAGDDAGPARYPSGLVRATDQSRRDGPWLAAFSEKTDSLSSHTLTRPPRSSRTMGPPSWNESLELHHYPALGHTVDSNGVAMKTPGTDVENFEGQLSGLIPWTESLKRGATFPVVQTNRTDHFLTPIVESPVLRSISSPPLRSKKTSITKSHRASLPAPLPARDHNNSPDTDETSVTQWPSSTLEPSPIPTEKPRRDKGSYPRRQARGSGSYQSLASIINMATRGQAIGANKSNSSDQRLQRQPSALSTRSRSPGVVPDSPVPPLPVKANSDGHRHDISTTRCKGFLSRKSAPLQRCPESFSSLQTTGSSILETIGYTASGQPIAHPLPSSPPNFVASPLSSHASSGPSIFDGMAADWGTPPAAGLTSPSVARLHRKQLSYGASRNSGGRGSSGLRQSVSCEGRMLREGSLASLATLGRPMKEGEEGCTFQYPSSSPGGGVPLLDAFPLRESNREAETPKTAPTAPATPSRKPNGPLSQGELSRFALPSPEPPPYHWAAHTTSMNNNSDPRSLFHWDFRHVPKGPRQPSPTKKGHRRQNCIRINYSPMELSTPPRCTFLSPIASVSDHPPTSTPRPPSPMMIFSPPPIEELTRTGAKWQSQLEAAQPETTQLETTQSEADLRDSPTFAMVNYYSCPPSPSHDGGDGSWRNSGSDIFITSDTSETTPPQLKSLKEPSPPPEHRTCIPLSPYPAPLKTQQTQHLRFSVLALRRMNSDISTTTSRAGEVARYLNLGGFGAGVGASHATGAASVASTRTVDDLLESSSEDQQELPRKFAKAYGETAAAVAQRRRRKTIDGGGGGSRAERIVGLGVGGVLE